MASSKKTAFYCSEENLTVVELDKNVPVHVIRVPAPARADTHSPFSSSLSEEIQVTELFRKALQDYKMQSQNVYVSLPMKDIILRSFTIPFVNPHELQKAIKFEARKYVPFDIEDLTLVFNTFAFMEKQARRLKVIFFALRNEVLARYERISQQLKVNMIRCEPCQVSLVKYLLFKKEIKPEDHIAFLYLDKTSGYICFISQGAPQFVREFQINSSEGDDPAQAKESSQRSIVNEVANSFEFYMRRFGGKGLPQMIVLSSVARPDLFHVFESELKVEVKQLSGSVGDIGETVNIDCLYAIGAGVDVPGEALGVLNFSKYKKNKSSNLKIVGKEFKDVLMTGILCVCLLAGEWVYFQLAGQDAQKKYGTLTAQQGAFVNVSTDDLQVQIAQNTSKLAEYKDIRIKSDVASVLLRVASLLPKGMWFKNVSIAYEGHSTKDTHATMEINGDVFRAEPNEQIAAVNDLVFVFRNDKVLSGLFSHVNMGPLTQEKMGGHDVTSFSIRCS